MRKIALNHIVLGTQNPGKIQELEGFLKPLGIHVQSLNDFPPLPEPLENGVTFQDNALLKALAYAKATGFPTLADDSGLCIEALDQKPGVHTKDFLADLGGAEKAFEVLEKMLQKDLKNASMHCVLAFAWPNGEHHFFEGVCEGELIFPARYGEGAHKGFGVDPIFRPNGHDQTFSQDTVYKKQVSHRTKALDAFMVYLKGAQA